MSKSYQIWFGYGNKGFGMLIPENEVESKVCIVEYIDWTDVEELTKEIFPESSFESLNDYVGADSLLCWDDYNKVFFDLSNCDTVNIYRWWDGSNWQTVEVEGMESTIDIEVEERSYILDEFDERNMCTPKNSFDHAGFQKIIGDEENYLLWTYSQYQGTHQEGKVVDRDELLIFIKEAHGEESAEEWSKEGDILTHRRYGSTPSEHKNQS